MVESGPSPYRWIGTNRSDVLRDCGGLLAELDTVIDGIFRRAAAKALLEWGWDESQYLDDLAQSMWVWYLESPGTQRQFANLLAEGQIPLVRNLANHAAVQILVDESIENDLSNNKIVYSTESVKDALKGRSTNKYLHDLIPLALQLVQQRDDELEDRGSYRGYAEAIRSRYTDGLVPKGSDADRLTKAHKTVAVEVNNLNLSFDGGTLGSCHRIPAEQRKRKGQYGDPTGDVAMALIEHGDNIIPVVDRTGEVTAITTYRREFYGDELIRRPV
ncbi:Uncharacterised protein [Mycobacteroides abscessus subsp. abscessus]|nr:Uncharacterised protein [Mycobacteroides abscessus subsp. abscessus]